MRALLSVSDKRGLEPFARGLHELGWELVASGNTAAALEAAHIPHRRVAEVTGSPEILGGRVKTLHPRIHGAILADRSNPDHLADLREHGIEPIDLVAVNLYPFGSDPSIELIDIGGPAMVRAAAKNFAHVAVVVSPDDYGRVLEELRSTGALSGATRQALAAAAFAHTAAYDAAIAAWFDQLGESDATVLPPTLHLCLQRSQQLHYGENPHQAGARYRLLDGSSWWDGVVQHGGRDLSYLNLFDADAAWRLAFELSLTPAGRGGAAGSEPAAVIVKHANPCGAAVAADLASAYRRALECDPVSAFGGVVALSAPVTAAVAEAVADGPQMDVIVAPSYAPEALERLARRRKSTRLLSAPAPEPLGRVVRSLGDSFLVQEPDRFIAKPEDWRVVTRAAPTDEQWADLLVAWKVCAWTSSNAVVVVARRQAVGVGAGQQSRVGAAEIAVAKAKERAVGGAAASDAFFPFPDGVEVLARAGVAAVVQPGGSVGDDAVVAAADEAGIAMVFTGERHFRH